MKWFKHMSDASNGSDLTLLEEEFGLEGYARWFKLLEAVSQNADPKKGRWSCAHPWSKWQTILKGKRTTLETFLEYLGNNFGINQKLNGNVLEIEIPNLKKFKDEYSRKSGQGTDSSRARSLEAEEDIREEREKRAGAHVDPPEPVEADPPPPSGPKKTDCPSLGRPSRQGFMACWQVYPIQQGQEEAWREWCRLEDNGTLEEAWAIRDKILMMAQEDDRWLGGFAPNMAKWLNGKGWQDQPYKKPKASPQGGQYQGQPRASTQAQKNSQDREGMALAVLKARESRNHADNIQGQNSGRIGGTGGTLPCGDDWSDADCPPSRCLGS